MNDNYLHFQPIKNYTKLLTITTEEEKKEIVIEFAARKGSGDKIANKYGTNRETIYNWQRNYIGSTHKEKIDNFSYNYDDLIKENEKLLLENKILKKANEILKKIIK